MNSITRKMLLIVLVIQLMACTAAGDKAEIDPDADVNVTVNAPEYVSEDTFEVTIDVTEIIDLNGGQFDLEYDPDVLKMLDVEAGNIDDTEVPIVDVRYFTDDYHDGDRVLFKLNGADCVSGSGYLVKITFEVIGGTGDTSIIDIITDPDKKEQPPNLAEADANNITANWFGTNVTIGTASAASDETPTPTETPAVNATDDELESTSAPTPTPTATPIETESLELSSNPPAMTASAESAPAAAVPDAASKGNGLPNIPKSHDLIPIYSLVGLFALIYTLAQFR
ncbi:MAG: cohesin domain-containing protein [Candidatus Methanogasteraceae archaeon]